MAWSLIMVILCFSSMCRAICSYSFGTLCFDMYLFLVRFAVTFSRHALLRTCLFFLSLSISLSAYSDLFIRNDEKACICQTLCSYFLYGLFVCRLDLYCLCFDGVPFVLSLPWLRGHLLAICIRCLLIHEWITKAGIFSSEKKDIENPRGILPHIPLALFIKI